MGKSIWDEAVAGDYAISESRVAHEIKSIRFEAGICAGFPWVVEFKSNGRKMAYSHEGLPASPFTTIAFVRKRSNAERIKEFCGAIPFLPIFLIALPFIWFSNLKERIFYRKSNEKRKRILRRWQRRMFTELIPAWRRYRCALVELRGWEDNEDEISRKRNARRARSIWSKKAQKIFKIRGKKFYSTKLIDNILVDLESDIYARLGSKGEAWEPWEYAESHRWVISAFAPLVSESEQFVIDETNAAHSWFTDHERQEARKYILSKLSGVVSKMSCAAED